MLNVSGRFNSEELSRDMTVGDDVKDEPFFEEGKNIAPQNVSALIGKTAFLTCVVRNLGKAKSVSTLSPAKHLHQVYETSKKQLILI